MSPKSEKTTPPGLSYRDAGVDIDAMNQALVDIKKLASSTVTPGVLSEIGSFGGLFRLAGGQFSA